MKKIPTLFTRVFDKHKVVDISPEITPGCETAFLYGNATVKLDGSCCAMIDGIFYKRYDAKGGKTPPEGAIPCCEPDPVTGHHPHWVKVDPNNPADRWFISALVNTSLAGNYIVPNGTYEAVGPHFQGNPYEFSKDVLMSHGQAPCENFSPLERTFEGVKKWLTENEQEGIVFWLDGEPVCKIKRTDFGLKWPVKGEKI